VIQEEPIKELAFKASFHISGDASKKLDEWKETIRKREEKNFYRGRRGSQGKKMKVVVESGV